MSLLPYKTADQWRPVACGNDLYTLTLAAKNSKYIISAHFAVKRDLKADDLKQNCAAAYAGTCQACIRCTAALRIGAPENGVIRNYATNSSGLEGRSAIMAERSSQNFGPDPITTSLNGKSSLKNM